MESASLHDSTNNQDRMRLEEFKDGYDVYTGSIYWGRVIVKESNDPKELDEIYDSQKNLIGYHCIGAVYRELPAGGLIETRYKSPFKILCDCGLKPAEFWLYELT
jgi:hypothetical protein